MPTYDYNVQQRPPSGANVGMDLFGVTLEQIMKRRHEQQLREQQETGDLQRAQMAAGTAANKLAADKAQHGITNRNAAWQGERDEDRFIMEAENKIAEHIYEGRTAEAEQYLAQVKQIKARRAARQQAAAGLDPIEKAQAVSGAAPRMDDAPMPRSGEAPMAPIEKAQALQAPPPATGRAAVEPPPFTGQQQPQPEAQSPPPEALTPEQQLMADLSPEARERAAGRGRDVKRNLAVAENRYGSVANDPIAKKVLPMFVTQAGTNDRSTWDEIWNKLYQDEADRQAGERNAGRMASRAGTEKGRDDERADVVAFENAYQKFENANNIVELTNAYDKFSEMRANTDNFTKDGSTIDLRSALYQTARYITGPGVLTPQEYQNTVSKTTGLLGSALTKVHQGLDGTISDQEAEALKKYVQNADSRIRKRAGAQMRTFDKKFGGGYFERTVPGEVSRTRAALMERFGVRDPKESQATIDESAAKARALLEGK